MKKALMIASVASMIEQFNMHNIELLQKLGYKVDIATNFENSGTITKERSKELQKQLKKMEVNCFQIDFSRNIFSKNNLKAYKQIKDIINNNNYNLIHMHSPIGGVCGRIAAKKARKQGTKIIYTAHGFHFYRGAPFLNWIIFYPIEKYLSKYTDCLITINQEDYEFAKKHLKAKQIELVHGVGVDESKFNFDIEEEERNNLRQELGLNKDDFVISYVAELNKNKNQIMAIEAIKDLVKTNKNVKLLLIGKGKFREFLENKIKTDKLEKNIFLLGYRNDVPKLLKISDLYISTSKREGLPVNIIEAMVSKLPIIATDCRGNRDLVNKVVKINDVEDLSNNIKQCMKNKDIYIYNTYDKYLLNNILNKMEKIYINEE